MSTRATGDQAASELAALLVELVPAWEEQLRNREPGSDADEVCLSLPIPDNPPHRLDLRVMATEVEIAWDDGQPPGPAEKLFIFDASERAEAHRVVADLVADLRAGEVLVVRQRLGRFPGPEGGSVPSFVRAEELAGIDPRRIAAVHCWDSRPARATPWQLSCPALYMSPRLDLGVLRDGARLSRCAAALMDRQRFYEELRIVDADAHLWQVASATVVRPRAGWARAIASFLDLRLSVAVTLDRLGPADLEEIRRRVQQAVANDPEILAEMTGRDPDWWQETLDRVTSARELMDCLASRTPLA